MGDTGALESLGHGDGRPLGKQLKLDDFRGDFHVGIMCAPAHLSTVAMCGLAESARAHSRAHWLGMATIPKTAAVQAYRREIGRYLEQVRLMTGWTLVELGQKAGGLAHTTISRAIKGENTLNFPALLAIEDASKEKIPDTLVSAARQAQQPAVRSEEEALRQQLRSVAEQMQGRPPDEQAEIIKELQALLAKAS